MLNLEISNMPMQLNSQKKPTALNLQLILHHIADAMATIQRCISL